MYLHLFIFLHFFFSKCIFIGSYNAQVNSCQICLLLTALICELWFLPSYLNVKVILHRCECIYPCMVMQILYVVPILPILYPVLCKPSPNLPKGHPAANIAVYLNVVVVKVLYALLIVWCGTQSW